MTDRSNAFLKLCFAGAIAWYIIRRTEIGREFVSDTSSIYQQTGFPEGLKSAYQLITKEK